MYEGALEVKGLYGDLGELATYGLGDAINGAVRPHTESFCLGRCADRTPTHRIQGAGKAKIIKLDTSEDKCPHCWGAVFWSNKYRSLRGQKDE